MLAREFDPNRPLVATSAFQAGEDAIAAGDAFDWRARGLSELDALALFSAGLLTHPAESFAEPTVEPKKRRSSTPKQQPAE